MSDSSLFVDRAAINDVLVRLAISQDMRDWTALAACFTVDAVYVHPGGELIGVDAIVERTRNALIPLDASQHLLGTMLISVEGDEATSSTYFQAQHVRRGTAGGELLIIAGTYRDRLARTADGWRITRRAQEYTWRDGNAEVTRRTSTPP